MNPVHSANHPAQLHPLLQNAPIPNQPGPAPQRYPVTPAALSFWLEFAKRSDYDPRSAAAQLRITLRQLERRCQHDLHLRPREFLHNTRLNFAADLLAKGEAPKCVALQLGYTHLSNFSRDFKRHTGLCPKNYVARLNSFPAPLSDHTGPPRTAGVPACEFRRRPAASPKQKACLKSPSHREGLGSKFRVYAARAWCQRRTA